jgi:hypothetical protein
VPGTALAITFFSSLIDTSLSGRATDTGRSLAFITATQSISHRQNKPVPFYAKKAGQALPQPINMKNLDPRASSSLHDQGLGTPLAAELRRTLYAKCSTRTMAPGVVFESSFQLPVPSRQ